MMINEKLSHACVLRMTFFVAFGAILCYNKERLKCTNMCFNKFYKFLRTLKRSKKGMVIDMPHISLYTWIFYFFIYAFIGWCAEVSYAAFVHGKFVNRGFLSGPICPIYGFGVCFVVLCLTPLKKNPFLLYIGAVLLTSLLEFVTGWLLERFFNQKWWDYSNAKFNLKGYVCLGFSLLWGVGCIAVVYLVHPAVENIVDLIPVIFGRIILAVFLTVFIADFIGTLAGVLRFKKTIRLVREFDDKLHDISDRIGENISDTVIAAIENGKKGEAKLSELREKYSEKYGGKLRSAGDFTELREKYENIMRRGRSFSAKRILSAFPGLKRDDRIGSIAGRVDNFFRQRYGKKEAGDFENPEPGEKEADITGGMIGNIADDKPSEVTGRNSDQNR